MPLLPPTMTSIPSISTSSDQMEERRERSRLGRARAKVVEGTTVEALCKADVHACAERGSPEPAPQNLDLSARFDSSAHHPGTRHPRQKPAEGPGRNRERHASTCWNRPALLFPTGHLLCLHGDLYVAISRRNGRTHSPLSVSRAGKKRSPGGGKFSCRLCLCHPPIRALPPSLLRPASQPLCFPPQLVL